MINHLGNNTMNSVAVEHNPFSKTLRMKREKNMSKNAMHDSFIHTGFYKKY